MTAAQKRRIANSKAALARMGFTAGNNFGAMILQAVGARNAGNTTAAQNRVISNAAAAAAASGTGR